MLKKLVVNADDFGLSPDVNDGIVEAHRSGILTATTLMANGTAFEHAVHLSRENPDLDIGAHLVLVSGRSLRTGQALPATVSQMIPAILRRQLDPLSELRPQIERILGAGVRITHLDTHKHTHLFSPVLKAIAHLSEEYGIPWVRRPFDFPSQGGKVPFSRRLVSRGLHLLRPNSTDVLRRYGCRFTDHFAGFELTGMYDAADVVRLLDRLPQGTTEFMCHPGYSGSGLQSVKTRLRESREQELRALVDVSLRDALRRNGILLTRYRDL